MPLEGSEAKTGRMLGSDAEGTMERALEYSTALSIVSVVVLAFRLFDLMPSESWLNKAHDSNP